MDKQDTRQRLLEASLKLISEKGYLGATTREIANGAGVTELTLFRHFGSKKTLFEEVLRSFTFLPRLKELLPELDGLPPDVALITVGMTFIDTLNKRRELVRILLSEVRHYPEGIRYVYERFINEVVKTMADYLKGRQVVGELRTYNPKMASRAFLGMLFSFFLSEVIIKGRKLRKGEVKKRVKGFVDVFIKGVGLNA